MATSPQPSEKGDQIGNVDDQMVIIMVKIGAVNHRFAQRFYLKRKEKTLRKQNIKSPRAIHAARAKQDTFGDGRLRPWCRRLQLDETCVLSDCGPFTPLCELKTTSSTKPEVYIALPPEKDRGTATDNVQKIWLNLHI